MLAFLNAQKSPLNSSLKAIVFFDRIKENNFESSKCIENLKRNFSVQRHSCESEKDE